MGPGAVEEGGTGEPGDQNGVVASFGPVPGRLLEIVRDREGVDLSSYRKATLERRVTGRLQKLGFKDYSSYLGFLDSEPGESRLLLEQVTIKVSWFFRNAPVFEILRSQVLPELISRHNRDLAAWSAGCGCGEEAYSLAILFHELLVTRYEPSLARVIGTDIDEGALERAKEGIYRQEALAETPEELAARYFTPVPGRHGLQQRLSPELKAGVSFVRHDLLTEQAAPLGKKYPLVLCRNVAIYYDRQDQGRLYRLLVDSLLPGGYLCLGEAEQLPPAHAANLETVNRSGRLYRRPQLLSGSPG